MNSGDGSVHESVEACAARERSAATSSDITIVSVSATTAEIESSDKSKNEELKKVLQSR